MSDDRQDFKPIRARITLRIHQGEIVASVSDEDGGITLLRTEPETTSEEESEQHGRHGA